MTKAVYLKNTYLFELESQIISYGHDDKGSFVIMDKTIFYPQGGGQPSDHGILVNEQFEFKVNMVRNTENSIRHYIEGGITFNIQNQPVIEQIDKNRRMLNARYHTAAHLLSNIVELLYPALKAVKGHSFPYEAYVEFQGNEAPALDIVQSSINESINQGYNTNRFETDPKTFEQQFYKLPYPLPNNKTFQVMQIGSFLPIPCGGTHISSISEIGNIAIHKIKTKNNIIRISYELL